MCNSMNWSVSADKKKKCSHESTMNKRAQNKGFLRLSLPAEANIYALQGHLPSYFPKYCIVKFFFIGVDISSSAS